MDLCQPWGLRRIERQHRGETGLVVSGRFKPLVCWVSAEHWARVGVRVDGSKEASVVLWEAKPGPRWLDLAPGPHEVHFIGEGTERLRTVQLRAEPGQAEIICFKAPVWRPFMRPTEERWCRRRLW
jgi:hypothetical protein